MQKCPSCGAERQAGQLYCPACARMPQKPSGPSYKDTWAFAGIGLLVVLFYWMGMTGANQPATPAALPKPALDDAAQLIANCGNPDRDVMTPAKPPKVPERRWLLYKSKNITAAFDRVQKQGTATWEDVRYFDHLSKEAVEPAAGREEASVRCGSNCTRMKK